MKIVKDVENKLLGRREIEATIEHSSSTLTRKEVKKTIAKKLKVDEALVNVIHIGNYFGDSQVNVQAKIYESEETYKKNARPHMIKRNTPEVKKEAEN